MEYTNLCPGCMQELTEENKATGCPHCGYQFQDTQEGQEHRLKPYTMLNNKYMIGKVLGEGGFGITYLGYDTTLEMKIAIKEYYPAGHVSREVSSTNMVSAFSGSSADFYKSGKEKFIKEARTLAKFSNLPGIVSVRDFFEENNTSYIIMEYLDGKTLKTHLKQMGGTLSVQETLEKMGPIIRSLEEVHKQGLIHRDISPDNIMIQSNGTMKLLDFGAARMVNGNNQEKSLSVMLKPGYAPEEQYRTHGNQGPWTDLYAICGTIYKCLTGKTPVEAMERMRSDSLMPPSAYGVRLEPYQEQALMKGLAVYAELRYASLDDFYQAMYFGKQPMVNNAGVIMNGGAQGVAQNPGMNEDSVTVMPVQDGASGIAYNQNQNLQGTVPGGYTTNGYTQSSMMGAPGANYAGMPYTANPEKKKNKTKLGIIIGSIGVAVAGIVTAIVLIAGGKGKDKKETEPDNNNNYYAQTTEAPTTTTAPVPSQGGTGMFVGDYSTTARGNAVGAYYEDYLLIPTRYGIAYVEKYSDTSFSNPEWAFQLNDGFKIESIAIDGDYAYVALGEQGLARLYLGDFSSERLSSGIVTSMAICGNKLFYIEKNDYYNSSGALYVANLDGSGATQLNDNVANVFMSTGSADFEVCGNSVYYIAIDSRYDGTLMCYDVNSGTSTECVNYNEYAEGVYYHGGKLYSFVGSSAALFAYDINTGALDKMPVAERPVSYYPMFFAGDELYYANEDWIYEDINGNVYPSSYNQNGGSVITNIGDGVYYNADYGNFYAAVVNGGSISSETYIPIEYYGDPGISAGMQGSDLNIDTPNGFARSCNVANYTGSGFYFKNNKWSNVLCYTDSNGAYPVLTDLNISYFVPVGDTMLYTTYTEDDGNGNELRQLWASSTSQNASDSQLLLNGVTKFTYKDGKIYYDDYNNSYVWTEFDLNTGIATQLNSEPINQYFVMDTGWVYYDCITDDCVYKMKLDGSNVTQLFPLSDYNSTQLSNIIAFDCNDATFLAFCTSEGEMYLTTEDGSGFEHIATGLQNFDLRQKLFYDNGYLFYSKENGEEVHALSFEEYLNSDVDAIPDNVIVTSSFLYFQEGDMVIYVLEYDSPNQIRVYDYLTGECYNYFDFSS